MPLTGPSHTSLFTSTYPFQNRIEENAEPVASGAVTLASVLRSHGYRTAAFVSSVFLEKEMGLDQGFDTYDSPFHYTAFSPLSGSMFFGDNTHNPNAGRDRRVAALAVRSAEQWMDSHRDQPVFVFLHLYDLHKPYRTPPGFTPTPGVAGYDAQLQYVDGILGSFRNFLVRGGWWDRSLVVLLADHGESLGEHGEAAHGYFIYESTLWVPLLIHWPSTAAPYPGRISHPAGLIDVAPTILDFLQVPAPASFDGGSLLGAGGPRPVYAESLHSHDSFGWAPLRSLRDGPFKYIEAPHAELYNLDSDPHEQRNLAGTNPLRARQMRAELLKLIARFPPRAPAHAGTPAAESRAALRSLGYLGSGVGRAAGGSGIDPKDGLPEFRLYEDAMADIYDGHLTPAISKLRAVVARDPKNTLARRDLGSCYVEAHNYTEARAELGRVASVAADDYTTQYELGIADEHLGLMEQALDHLQVACKLAPEAEQCRRELDGVRKNLGNHPLK